MRERLARIAAVLLTVTVALLAAFFAERQNAGEAAAPEGGGPPPEAGPEPPPGVRVEPPEGVPVEPPESVGAPEGVGARREGVGIEEPADPALIARGREVYDDQACGRCHAIAGTGNPRSPLDGVGARRTPAEIAAWITADASVRDRLSPSVVRAKQRFAELPDADVRALATYLSTLR